MLYLCSTRLASANRMYVVAQCFADTYVLIVGLTQLIVAVQVGGFLQRIDYVRKYAFGVMCILKNSEGQFPIRGFWIFRGQDIPQMMKDECYDLELYDWQKLDSKNLDLVSLVLLQTALVLHTAEPECMRWCSYCFC